MHRRWAGEKDFRKALGEGYYRGPCSQSTSFPHVKAFSAEYQIKVSALSATIPWRTMGVQVPLRIEGDRFPPPPIRPSWNYRVSITESFSKKVLLQNRKKSLRFSQAFEGDMGPMLLNHRGWGGPSSTRSNFLRHPCTPFQRSLLNTMYWSHIAEWMNEERVYDFQGCGYSKTPCCWELQLHSQSQHEMATNSDSNQVFQMSLFFVFLLIFN